MNKSFLIYIIDDDPITRFGLKKILTRDIENVEVQEYRNGELAKLELERNIDNNQLPDAIFLDINMPIMDGWEFLQEISRLSIEKSMIINILTSSIDPLDNRKYEFYKTNSKHTLSFMSKPILKICKENVLPENIVQ